MTDGLELDADNLLKAFDALTGKEMKQVYKKSLKAAASILVKETRNLLEKITTKSRNKNRWNGRTLQQGIGSSVDMDELTAKVHIMGDFRLKFFELGTNERQVTTRKGKQLRKAADRGKMTGLFFFRRAQQNVEKEVFSSMEEIIARNIAKISVGK